jgi:DNA ligase (NAD+)
VSAARVALEAVFAPFAMPPAGTSALDFRVMSTPFDIQVSELEALIRHHNRLYWDETAPEISDSEYDQLVLRLKALAPASPVLVEMGPKERTLGAEFHHREPMLSLDKCYEGDELAEWGQGFDGHVVATPKFDGIACALHYDAHGRLTVAATRGDGVIGDDITQNALGIRDIPAKIPASRPLEVRGEIYMRLSVFAKFKAEGMANPRNLTAGAVKLKDRARSAAYGLSFVGYDLMGSDETTEEAELAKIEALGFPTIDRFVLARDALMEGVERFTELRPKLDYEIDGVVFKVNEIKEQRRLGQTAHHPRFALAYKFQGDSGISTLREVVWSVARTGAITPVAIVEPVTLSGVTVTRASLHNVGFIAKLGLTLNAKVTLVRRGGVIPNVENVSVPGDAPVLIPEACPGCGSPVVRRKDFLFCSTPRTCKGAILGQLGHFVSTIDARGFGDAILEQAYDAGLVRAPADFYTLKWEDLERLERCGEKLAKKLVAEIDAKRKLALVTFLRALGIAELGKNVSSILASRYRTLSAVLAATEEELASTHGIGETIARSVVAGLVEMRPSIDALLAHVTLTQGADESEGVMGPLSGKSFVFTGKMLAFSRSEGEKRVRAKGGAVLSGVTAGLTYLVVGADKTGPKSAKEKAAEKLIAKGAPLKLLSESELLAELEAPR